MAATKNYKSQVVLSARLPEVLVTSTSNFRGGAGHSGKAEKAPKRLAKNRRPPHVAAVITTSRETKTTIDVN